LGDITHGRGGGGGGCPRATGGKGYPRARTGHAVQILGKCLGSRSERVELSEKRQNSPEPGVHYVHGVSPPDLVTGDPVSLLVWEVGSLSCEKRHALPYTRHSASALGVGRWTQLDGAPINNRKSTERGPACTNGGGRGCCCGATALRSVRWPGEHRPLAGAQPTTQPAASFEECLCGRACDRWGTKKHCQHCARRPNSRREAAGRCRNPPLQGEKEEPQRTRAFWLCVTQYVVRRAALEALGVRSALGTRPCVRHVPAHAPWCVHSHSHVAFPTHIAHRTSSTSSGSSAACFAVGIISHYIFSSRLSHISYLPPPPHALTLSIVLVLASPSCAQPQPA
jgi:hypothetical protein